MCTTLYIIIYHYILFLRQEGEEGEAEGDEQEADGGGEEAVLLRLLNNKKMIVDYNTMLACL